LLMPLVENAFKFVSSFPDRANQVRIRLSFNNGQFHFEIGNTVDEFTHTPTRSASASSGIIAPGPASSGITTVPAGGIGLENVRRRLELLYPTRHTLTIETGKEYYTVSLKLQVA
jgi:two-component system LytT family sensor kinase